ncbi:hypothetical protein ACFXTH_000203 [Malus domestica]
MPANSGGVFRSHHHHLEALIPLYKTHPRTTLVNPCTSRFEATKPDENQWCSGHPFHFSGESAKQWPTPSLGFVAYHPRRKSRPALTPLEHRGRRIEVHPSIGLLTGFNKMEALPGLFVLSHRYKSIPHVV